jgi:hypothetical protein
MDRTSRSRCRATRGRPFRIILWPLSLVVLLLACGTGSQVGVTAATALLPFTPVVRAATARVASHDGTPVTASCQAGERMLGGGFIASNLFEYAAYVTASYPSGPATWTVVASAPASYFQLEADVYCAPAPPATVEIHIIHATGTGTATAACPLGTVLLGGGFQASEPVEVSRPEGNGWLAGGSGAQAYALCAAHLVQPGRVVHATFNPHSMTRNYAPDGRDAICPSGQIALGGGFDGDGLVLASVPRGASFDGWAVEAGGNADVTISAVCVVPWA